MANVWFDTSALVKLYVTEKGTARVTGLIEDSTGFRAVILDIAPVEARSAIRRREREGDISRSEADRILRRIDDDAASFFEVTPSGAASSSNRAAVLEEAARLLDRHPLRAYDAMQLAGCRIASRRAPGPWKFACADARLCAAAEREGLTPENPIAP